MLSEFLGKITASAVDAALNAFWVLVGGVVLTGAALIVAYLKGAGRHVLWFLGGAIASAMLLLLAVLVVIWSGRTVLIVTTLGLMASLGVAQLLATWAARAARIANADKGLFDYWEQFQHAQLRTNTALAGITRETDRLAEIATKQTTLYLGLKEKSELDRIKEGRSIARKGAKQFDSAAARFKHHAALLQTAQSEFMGAMDGIIQWHRDNDGTEKVQEAAAALSYFRNVVSGSLEKQALFRNSVLGLPRMSREMNAATKALAEAIDDSVVTMRDTLVLCDAALAKIGS